MLDGRLDDAEFAFDRDLAEGLPAMADRLGAVVFHEKLGSLADKASRLGGLVAALAGGPACEPDDNGSGETRRTETLRTAARLAKADLVSQTVIEFPVLQGIMGGIFAEAGGLGDAVARAVGEHYRPLSATAPLPATVPGALLAVADKLDNIAGAWVAGEKPSGSRDPYGLRRAAMGIVRIALEYSLRFPLAGLLTAAVDQFELQGIEGLDDERRSAIVAETAAFVRERLQVLLLDEGLPFPAVEAAMAAPAADLPSLASRARVFAAMAGREVFESAVIAYNRCSALAAKDPAAGRAPSTRPSSPTTPSASCTRPSRLRAGRCSTPWTTSSSRAPSRPRPACGRPSTATSTPCSSWIPTRPCAPTVWRSSPPSPASSAASESSAACRSRRRDVQETPPHPTATAATRRIHLPGEAQA